MIEEPRTLTINRALKRPTKEQISAFQNTPTGFVVDALFGGGALSSNIRPIGEGRDILCQVAGPALSVNSGPGDILAALAALDSIEDGDIVVNSFGGYQGCAAGGDRLLAMMKNNGAAGFITDGPLRDYTGIIEVNLPVWCTGLTPASPFAKGPGSVGLPIQMAGQQIETGDMIVGDIDGVVVVPFDKIDAVIIALEKVRQLETELDAQVREGLKMPQSIRDFLNSDEVEYVET